MQKNKYGSIISLFAAAMLLAVTVFFIAPASPKAVSNILKAAGVEIKKESSFFAVGVKSEVLSENTLNEVLTDVTGAAESTQNDNSDLTDINALTDDEYEPPADVLKIQEEYEKKYANAEQSGTVKEYFFKTDAATNVIEKTAIRNVTASKKPNFAELIKNKSELVIDKKSEPTVLIFHTHTTESYLLSDNGKYYKDYKTRSSEPQKNMIRVGNELSCVLKANGIGVIHDLSIYDNSYNGAYARSRQAVLDWLNEYPSIKIVLDVHRDAIKYSDTVMGKPTAVINKIKAAQIMIITGAEEGNVTDFPNWEKNLSFALEIQSVAQNRFYGLMKPLYFCQRKYNMDVTPFSLLLEIGSDGNTLEEAVYSANLMGRVLSEIITEHEVKDD